MLILSRATEHPGNQTWSLQSRWVCDVAPHLSEARTPPTVTVSDSDLRGVSWELEMSCKEGMKSWWAGLVRIAAGTEGIERVVAVILYGLTLISPTQWVHICGPHNRRITWLIDSYVFGVFVLSVIFFRGDPPNVWGAALSTYFSVTTIVVLLNIVLLQRVFGEIPTPERSLILFIFNVAQLIVMFATWYVILGHYSNSQALLYSILAFATISYPDQAPPWLAMVQIGTNFILLAVFLSFLVSQLFGRHMTVGTNPTPGTAATPDAAIAQDLQRPATNHQ